jgi:hypothetical protein
MNEFHRQLAEGDERIGMALGLLAAGLIERRVARWLKAFNGTGPVVVLVNQKIIRDLNPLLLSSQMK